MQRRNPTGICIRQELSIRNDVGPWVGKVRWEKERELSHELYDAGHFMKQRPLTILQPGKKHLLNIALKNADLVCSVFGPDKKHVLPVMK